MIIGADLDDGAPEPRGPPRPGSLERLAAGRALDKLAAERGLTTGAERSRRRSAATRPDWSACGSSASASASASRM